MKPFRPPSAALASAAYVACRYGGAPPGLARVELELAAEVAEGLEQRFQARPGGGPDPMKPRFARHAEHVSAVMAAGGYPVLPARCR